MTEVISEPAPRRTRTGALDRMVQIFDLLQVRDRPATAYEIARALGAPLSSIYQIVDDLVAKDMLDRLADGNLWFGPKLYHYGLTYGRHLDLLGAAEREMADLVLASGETVQLCGRDGDCMVVLAMAEGADHFQIASRIGTRTPLNWSASGRLLVGHLGEAERRAVFAQSAQPSPTRRAETDVEILTAASRTALDEGICIQAGESDYAIACIAAPIRDGEGACRATISIVVPDLKVDQAAPDLKSLVRASAERIARRMGWVQGTAL